jgi:hypothetical protein
VRRALPVLCLLALVAAGRAAAVTLLPGFHSPSGNIRCFLVPGRPSVLRCEIAHSSYGGNLQARCMRPDGSGVDWHGFELSGTGKGAITCSGGILYDVGEERPSFANLPYGKSWRVGVFTCASRVTGVTCRNRLGHGLFLSRESWKAW